MKPHVICLVLDRLRAAALGAYGAAWCETAALDRLASQSWLFDQMFCSSLQLDSLYHELWSMPSNSAADVAGQEAARLPTFFEQAGYQTALLTDESAIAEHPLAEFFAKRTFLRPTAARRSARSIDQTSLAQFFAAAAETLRSLPQASVAPSLVWLHSQAMAAPWDAPWKMREALAGEEDPRPPRELDVPNLSLAPDADPDIRLGHTQSYTAQVGVADACLEVLLDEMDDSGLADDSLLVVLGARGFALGEHASIGEAGDCFYQECLHVPLLLRFPNRWQSLARTSALCHDHDLGSILKEVLEMGQSNEPLAGSMLARLQGEQQMPRDRLCFVQGQERAIRTPAWFLRMANDQAAPELFVKPDDRFEMNEVAARCPAIVEGLVAALDAQEQTPLASELVDSSR